MSDALETVDSTEPVRPTATMPPLRQCGRCRLFFPVDAGTPPEGRRDWWTCPTCHDALFA